MSYNRYGIILIFVFSWVYVYGQTNDKDRLIEDYDRQFQRMDSLMRMPFGCDRWENLFLVEFSSLEQSVVPLSFLEKMGQDGVSRQYVALEEVMNQRNEAEEAAVRSETGLQFTSNYAYRKSTGSTSYWDDEGDFSQLNHRFQSEISWNILQSSLVQAKNKIAVCRIGSELERVGHKEDMLSAYVRLLIIRNEQIYRQAVERIYTLRLEHLHLLEQTEQALLEHHSSGSDRLLEIMNDIFLLEQKLSSGVSTDVSIDGLAYNRTDTVYIQTDRLLEMVDSCNYELVKWDLNRELLKFKVKQASFLASCSISPYLRYSAYHVVGRQNQSTVDMGVALRIPLSVEASKSRKLLKMEQKVCEANRNMSSQALKDEILRCIRDMYGWNDKLCQEYGRLSQIRCLLETRSEAYSRMDGIYSRPARIREYALYLACLEEILRLKYERNKVLIHLQGHLPNVCIGSLVEFLPVN